MAKAKPTREPEPTQSALETREPEPTQPTSESEQTQSAPQTSEPELTQTARAELVTVTGSAPAEQTSEPEPTQTALEKAVSAAAETQQALDELFEKLARGGEATAAEFGLLHSRGFDNKFAIEREVQRTKTRLEWKEQAGTRASRDELRTRVLELEREFAKKGPEIEKRIADFVAEQTELVNRLKRPYQEALQQLERREEAARNLLRMLPEHLQTRCNALKGQMRSRFSEFTHAGKRVAACKERLAVIDTAATYAGKSNLELPNGVLSLANTFKLFADSGRAICPHKLAAYRTLTQSELQAAQAVIERDGDEFARCERELREQTEALIE